MSVADRIAPPRLRWGGNELRSPYQAVDMYVRVRPVSRLLCGLRMFISLIQNAHGPRVPDRALVFLFVPQTGLSSLATGENLPRGVPPQKNPREAECLALQSLHAARGLTGVLRVEIAPRKGMFTGDPLTPHLPPRARGDRPHSAPTMWLYSNGALSIINA